MNKLVLLALFTFGFLIFGCILSQPPPAQETNTTPVIEPPKTPVFSIISPSSGSSITSSDGNASILLKISTTNIVLKPAGGKSKFGEGHFVLTLDGASVGTFSTKTYTLENMAPGEHTIRIDLVNNDGKPYSPAVYKAVSFTVVQQVTTYQPVNYVVAIKDFNYDPYELTVKYHDTITFVNSGSFPRSATAKTGSTTVFDSGIIAPGQNATVSMNQLGDWDYFSLTYLVMRGKVHVVGNGIDN